MEDPEKYCFNTMMSWGEEGLFSVRLSSASLCNFTKQELGSQGGDGK